MKVVHSVSEVCVNVVANFSPVARDHSQRIVQAIIAALPKYCFNQLLPSTSSISRSTVHISAKNVSSDSNLISWRFAPSSSWGQVSLLLHLLFQLRVKFSKLMETITWAKPKLNKGYENEKIHQCKMEESTIYLWEIPMEPACTSGLNTVNIYTIIYGYDTWTLLAWIVS